jgi:hypothetical protein
MVGRLNVKEVGCEVTQRAGDTEQREQTSRQAIVKAAFCGNG